MSSNRMPARPLVRLVLVPLTLFVTLGGGTFALAKLHFAKPGTPRLETGGAPVIVGDAGRGRIIFGQTCAGCHGEGGTGGIGPRLIDDRIALAQVRAQIEAGGGAMPPKLVSGQQERDVLAYVGTLVAAP